MYAKLFSSIFQGTLRGNTHCLVVFTNLLAHADKEGWADIHPKAISEEVGLSVAEVNAAITELESPDPESRSPEEEGRRIVRLDDHRAWGWRVVNYAKYRAIRSEDDRREQNRLAQQRFRDKSNQSKPRKPQSAHTEVDTDTDTDTKSTPLAPSPSASKPAASKKPVDTGEVVENIPLNDNSEFEVRESFVAELDRLYPAVDPKQTLREIRGWCIGNPTKRKTSRGVKAFLTSWFAREQDKQSRRI